MADHVCTPSWQGTPSRRRVRSSESLAYHEFDFTFYPDGIAAGLFQIKEAFAGYRQSMDQASKLRVREAANAALNSLPDWPPLTY